MRLCLLLAILTAVRAVRGAKEDLSMGDYEGSRITLLAIDDHSLPLRQNLCYYLSTPAVRAEPVLTPSRDNPHATDTKCCSFYGTVLHEGGRFRMWYFGLGLDRPTGQRLTADSDYREGPVCYAESRDGLHWIKPRLGQVKFGGGSDNNAIALPPAKTEGVYVIRDDDDPDPARRYKMVYESMDGITVETAVSADGIAWRPGPTAAGYLEPSAFYKYNGLYIISAQNSTHVGEGGHRTGRQGFVWVSPDFDHWLPQSGESFLLPEPADPNARGSDRPYLQAHLGVGATSYGNVLVGLYCQFHSRPKPGDWFGAGATYGDLGLVVSNDGLHFREVVKGFVFLDRRRSPAAINPQLRSEEILEQSGNGILNVGGQTWIYHGRWMNTEDFRNQYDEIALATLRRDRWGALGLYPAAREGSVWTGVIGIGQAIPSLFINGDGVTGMRVEIADERFRLLPDYSGANAGKVAAPDGLDRPVSWPARLDRLRGRKVRLLLHLEKSGAAEPRFFAAYLLAA